MTLQDWGILVTLIGTTALGVWNTVTNWLDKREVRKFNEEVERNRLKDAKDLAERQAAREAAEDEHRRRMEVLAKGSIRQGALAAKKAEEAVTVAVTSKKDLAAAIENSVSQRKVEAETIKEAISTVAAKVDENTQVNKDQIVASNNFNGKLDTVTAQIQGVLEGQKPTDPPA